MGNNISVLQYVKIWLSKNFCMKDLREATYILGIKIYRDRSKRFLGLSHSTYIDDECKTHLCFEFISHVILCILYPYSCKTHKISSKLGFVGLLMKSK